MIFLSHHRYAFKEAWKYFFRKPVASFLMVAVIGFALTLPTALAVLKINLSAAIKKWDRGLTILVSLKSGETEAQIQSLVQTLREKKEIQQVTVLTPAQALAEFEKQTGLSGSTETLGENPLPTLLEVYPAPLGSPEAVEALYHTLQQMPEISEASLDTQWVKQLYGWGDLAKHLLNICAGAFVVGITIILMQLFRGLVRANVSEADLIRRLGGTRAFVRRPYLYMGLLYGILGSGMACGLLALAIGHLAEPVSVLVSLYNSDIALRTLGMAGTFILIGGGGILGVVTAWMALAVS